MDLLCLMITAALLHREVKRMRALLAALLGGAYAVWALLFGIGGAIGILLDFCAALLMCAIAFFEKKMRFGRLFRCAAVQTLVSMVLGGVMTVLYSLLNRLRLPFEALQGDGLSVWTFALLTGVSGLVTLRGGRFFGLSQKTESATVHARLFGKELTLRAMVDSGNLLRDPVGGKAVIVADLSRVRSSLPPLLVRAYESGDFTEWLAAHERAKRVRPIPTRTATGTGILFAMVPERLTVTRKGETHSADLLIAVAPLGATAAGFDAVLPAVCV